MSRTLLLLAAILLPSAIAFARLTPADVKSLDRSRVLAAANTYLTRQPVTITASSSPRSAGGPHDYFSEGDYWWPNPADPTGPYIQRDGLSNPDNFNAHRFALMDFSIQSAALTAAWKITGDTKYADHAIAHLRAWFISPDTKMNPHLKYAQAIHGITTGRGIGIIDTLHLTEVARSAQLLEQAGLLKGDDLAGTQKWFADYLTWMTTSKPGQDEMNAKNNHGTCWAVQVAAFATFTKDTAKQDLCRQRYKEILLPTQMAPDGSFPQELRRTKPYGYALFNLDAMTTLAHILSTPTDNLWTYTTPDGKNLRKAVEYMTPYIADKKSWPLKPDVMYWENWPVRSPSLLFAALAYNEPQWLTLWQSLDPNPTEQEVLRNLPLRQPVLWVD